MTDPRQHPGFDGSPLAARRGMSAVGTIACIVIAAVIAGGVVWWLQDARVQAREAARAEAAAQLEKTLGLLKASETTAATAAEQLKQAKGAVDAATKQAADATAQLDTVRRDAAGARTERDQAKAALAGAKADLERARAADADPGLLPAMELGKVLGGIRQVRASTALQLRRSESGGLDSAALDSALAASLVDAGLTVGPQSPYRVRLLVTSGGDRQPYSVGLLMLLMRTFKVPGENGSREVAIWGQQRTSEVSDDTVLAQVRSMVGDLCRELGAAMNATPAAPAPSSAAPAASAPNGPKP